MKTLQIKRSISKARDTAGYNIVTLWDGKTKYSACGGGYDMLGTVFGNWMKANYLDCLKNLIPYDEKAAHEAWRNKEVSTQVNYGLFRRGDNWCVDGGCGLECMLSLAAKIGLKVDTYYAPRHGYTAAFVVRESNES